MQIKPPRLTSIMIDIDSDKAERKKICQYDRIILALTAIGAFGSVVAAITGVILLFRG